ncbi:hypothetical protein NC653_007050 [Populus alba x Populus x berolinensis]|uniref:Uncharacterized protein n=1 Tax=Populus alba x Populus x berolinensis TaxID=444605 RepID=A0AAD6RGC2_9ROSI|nr:hypothetical protein NC653_007050 [Populus alba x Populus x berolinensis]
MEGVSARIYTKMKEYWSRRGYERINGSGRTRRSWPLELGSVSTTSRRRRRRMPSPKRCFVWLRDAYVKMMLGFANSRAIGTAGKEYDEKMINEIYKSLVVAEGQLVPRDAPTLGFMPKLTAIAE